MGAFHKARGIEAIAVRRAKVADAGKVRYRVYRSPKDFVAVIAENALMAIKVAQVSNPYRVVRDLPTAEIAIEAEKIAKAEANQKVAFATAPKENTKKFSAELAPEKPPLTERFTPIQLAELNKKSQIKGFILPQEALHQLIEAVRKPSAPPPPPPSPEPAPVLQTAPEPVQAPTPEAPAAPAPTPGQLAAQQEFAPVSKSQDPSVLSPQEVEQLLNE